MQAQREQLKPTAQRLLTIDEVAAPCVPVVVVGSDAPTVALGYSRPVGSRRRRRLNCSRLPRQRSDRRREAVIMLDFVL